MTTTYYVLRTKTTAIGNGSYLGVSRDGINAIVNSMQGATRFDALEEADLCAAQVGAELGEFEVEVRNTNETQIGRAHV